MLNLSERKIRLQLFAEEGSNANEPGADTAENGNGAAADQSKGNDGAKGGDEKKYSDADLDKIIGKKFAAWQEKKEKEVEEAKNLEKIN